jgi:AcrR family transcriptional regulator
VASRRSAASSKTSRLTPSSPPRTYRGQSDADRREERRERLLASGLALFGTKGYAATSIEDVCTTAGVTARHFYEQFTGREALLRAIYDGIIAETRRAVVRAVALASGGPQELVTAGVDAFVHSYLDDPRRARIACIEVIGVSSEMERHRRAVIHDFAAVIQAQAEGLAAHGALSGGGNYELAGIATAGAVNELMSDWIMRRDRPSLDAFIHDIVSFFMALVLGGRSLSHGGGELRQ